MKNSAILRTAKVGGFNKDDVLTYVDELNAKIDSLKEELDKAKSSQAEAGELDKYKNEVERLKERLSETENKLSEARTNADSERSELQNQKNAATEENNELKNEIEALKYQLESAQNNAAAADTASVQTVDTSEFERNISDLNYQLENAKSQITEMSREMTSLTSDISEKSAKIERLAAENKRYSADNSKLTAENNRLVGENGRLSNENENLRLNANDGGFSSFDMGALFSEAQATARRVVVEAKMAADKLVKDAQSEADKIISEANVKAEKINAEAIGKAAIMEDEAGKNIQSAVSNTEKLKQLFRTEAYLLDKKLSDLIVNIESTTKMYIRDIEAARDDINVNIDTFLNSDGELKEVTVKAEKIIADMPKKTPKPIEEPESVLGSFAYEEKPKAASDDTAAETPLPVIEEIGFDENQNESSRYEKVSDPVMENIVYDEKTDVDDYDFGGRFDEYTNNYGMENDLTSNDDGINVPPITEIDGIPYVSVPDEEDDFSKPSAEEKPSAGKPVNSGLDDILSSFSIDPIPDDDDEPAPIPKKAASLGFDLGDLAKLAEEAEKEL